MQDSICELVRTQEQNYITGETTISKYVQFNQYENIEKIDAYLNSKHISGLTDSLGREKPFFNIVTAAVNIWYRATDIDRKNIRIKATKQSDIFSAFLASVHLQKWMRKENFGAFLNEWGRALARYGSVPLKFVEKGDELHCMVIPWNRFICDPVDFDAAPRIEILELTPAQLREREGYDQDMVEKLIQAVSARKTLDGQTIDNRSNFIKVYEVHGNLPLSFITERESDEKTYAWQMHVVSFVESNDKEDEYDDFTLIKGREEHDPYMMTHLIKEDGRTQSIGAVEHLFEAQWMVNHTAKNIKDQLDLASKIITQTSDTNFVGQNVLSAIEQGDILIHGDGKPLTRIDTRSDITSLQAFGSQWQALAKEITSTPDAIAGNTMPSGTAYRQVAILNQESHSLFEIMTENKGLHIEEMMRRFVIPHIKRTKLDSKDEITATLNDYQITQIDSVFTKNKAIQMDNEQKKKAILSGHIAENLDLTELQNSLQESLNAQGSQRFFKPSELDDKTWKELFDDLEWELDVEVTGEQEDLNTVVTTLTTVFQTIATNPGILEDPTARMVFNRILEKTGALSPIELPATPKPITQPTQMNPAEPKPLVPGSQPTPNQQNSPTA